MRKIQASIHPDDDLHYEKMGLKKDLVEVWEDGARIDGSRGTYEWWYYDSHYPNGMTLVLFFYCKNPIAVDGPIKPIASMELTLPDGRKFSEEVYATLEESHYTKEMCDVKIGPCWCRGDLKHYDAVFVGKNMSARLSLDGTIPAWRSQTGSIFFGDNEEHYFAWLPGIPEGKAVADITYDGGKELHLEGSGYHDHNWGNISMLKLMHHWYWGRAKVGDYKVISSWITAEKKYGYKEFDVFMLAKGDKILGDNSNHTLKFMPDDGYTDEHTELPTHGTIGYEYTTEDGDVYRITYRRSGDIARQRFSDLLPPVIRNVARVCGFKSGYIRFEGTATIERLEGGEVIESVTDPAVWEMMYFGKPGADKENV